MSNEEVLKKVQSAKRYRKLIECRRRCIAGNCFDRGYVVDANEHYVLLHKVDQRIELDGYTVIRTDDIIDVACDFDEYKFIEKALALRKMEPERPALVDLTDMEAMLTSIEESFPLVVVHREEAGDDSTWVGAIESIGNKTFTLRELNLKAKWDGSKRIRFDDVTRIEFDGGYETAMAQVAGVR